MIWVFKVCKITSRALNRQMQSKGLFDRFVNTLMNIAALGVDYSAVTQRSALNKGLDDSSQDGSSNRCSQHHQHARTKPRTSAWSLNTAHRKTTVNVHVSWAIYIFTVLSYYIHSFFVNFLFWPRVVRLKLTRHFYSVFCIVVSRRIDNGRSRRTK